MLDVSHFPGHSRSTHPRHDVTVRLCTFLPRPGLVTADATRAGVRDSRERLLAGGVVGLAAHPLRESKRGAEVGRFLSPRRS